MRLPVDRLTLKAAHRLGRFRPTPETLGRQRWLRWLGPSIAHPGLWSVNRHAIALGLAIGMFFGLLIPIAQMPLSAAVAVLLRANLPTAVVSTLVTNPVTVAPLYYAAWRLGKPLLLGLALMATLTGLAAYVVVSALWWLVQCWRPNLNARDDPR